MTPNTVLLRAVMDNILAHPEGHDQRWFARRTGCGTTECFAGRAVALAGYPADYTRLLGGEGEVFDTVDGDDIEHYATELLGLDPRSALYLFNESNTTTDLKHMVDELCDHGEIR